MRMFECENCHSVLIVNESDGMVRSGDYDSKLLDVVCPLCQCDMYRFDRKQDEE